MDYEYSPKGNTKSYFFFLQQIRNMKSQKLKQGSGRGKSKYWKMNNKSTKTK